MSRFFLKLAKYLNISKNSSQTNTVNLKFSKPGVHDIMQNFGFMQPHPSKSKKLVFLKNRPVILFRILQF